MPAEQLSSKAGMEFLVLASLFRGIPKKIVKLCKNLKYIRICDYTNQSYRDICLMYGVSENTFYLQKGEKRISYIYNIHFSLNLRYEQNLESNDIECV